MINPFIEWRARIARNKVLPGPLGPPNPISVVVSEIQPKRGEMAPEPVQAEIERFRRVSVPYPDGRGWYDPAARMPRGPAIVVTVLT